MPRTELEQRGLEAFYGAVLGPPPGALCSASEPSCWQYSSALEAFAVAMGTLHQSQVQRRLLELEPRERCRRG